MHLPDSDLDVICHVRAPKAFMALLVQRFGDLPSFALGRTTLQRKPAVVCSFRHQRTLFEIVGMPVAPHRHRAYVHLMVEADLLQETGAHAAIRRLRRQGLKTEPAFARHFKLGGDPYQAVAKLWRRKPVSGVTLVTTARLALPVPSLKSKRMANLSTGEIHQRETAGRRQGLAPAFRSGRCRSWRRPDRCVSRSVPP